MSRTLWDALCGIEDRRGRKGRQYELPSLLGISIAAMLAGANDLIAIFRWGRRLKPEALRLFGIDDGVAPCHATFHYFFKSLDADALAAALGKFALGDDRARHIAIDGKTLKGSRRLDAKALHMLSAFATSSALWSAILWSSPTRTKSPPPWCCSRGCRSMARSSRATRSFASARSVATSAMPTGTICSS